METSKIPGAAIALGYFAIGFCLLTSGIQMFEIFQKFNVGGQTLNAIIIAAAILFGTTVMWRLGGHMLSRPGLAVATSIVLIAAVYGEGISIVTSTMSLASGVNERVIEDTKTSDAYGQTKALSESASAATKRLTENLENMPRNYFKMGERTGDQINEMMAKQIELTKLQMEAGKQESATVQTMAAMGGWFGMNAEQFQYFWAVLVAFGLSFIPLATQVAFGALSDGVLAERHRDQQAFGAAPSGKSPALRAVG